MNMGKKFMLLLLLLILVNSLVFATGTSEKPDQKQTVQVWLGWPGLLEVFNRAKADFEAENPNIELEITAMNLRDFEQKLAVALPAGTGPDIFITSEYIVPLYVSAGLVATPPDHIVEFVENNFDELVKRVNKFKGPDDPEPRLYGVPHIGIARVQYFNKDLMKSNGLEPKAPETWEELFDAARKIVQYDKDGNITRSGMSLRIFGGGSGIGEKFMIKLVQAGGSFLGRTADGGWKAAYNSEAGVDAMSYYLDALYTYKIDSFEAKHDTEAFVNGLTAFYDRELFPVPIIHKTSPNLSFGTAPMPGKVYRGTVYSTESYFVPKSAKNKDLAWDVIMFFQREPYVKAFFKDQGWIPPRTDIDFSDIFEIYPEYRAAFEFPEGYRLWLYPPLAQSDEIITKFAERIAEGFKDSSLAGNRKAIRTLLDKIAEETNSILKDAGLLGEGSVVAPGDVIEAPKDMGYQYK
jgi:multiple sugar transport system substrate-binding protein